MAETTSLTYLSDYTGPQIDAAVKKITDADLENLQPKLISGTNIKTINGNAILGNGDLDLVQANITETGTPETLNNLSVNGKIYKISNESGALTEIENIKNGTTVVGKAKADQNGNIIDTYYATKQETETLAQSVASAVETSQQAKTAAEAAMPKTGGTFTGAINVPEPTENGNPTTMEYVDRTTQHHSVLLDQVVAASGTGFLKKDADGYSLQQSAVAIDDNSIVENSTGALQLKQEYIDYLDNVLYEAPSISEFMLGDQYYLNNEVGTNLEFNNFKHRESYIKNIDGNLQLLMGSEIIKEVTPTETSTTIPFDGEISMISVWTTTTFRLKGIDIKGKTFTKDYIVNFYRYAYTNTTQSSTAPTTGVKQSPITSFASNGADFTYNAQDYIYFYTVDANKKVQTYVLGQWADVDSEYMGIVDLTQNNGVVFGYNVYRIGPFISSGTAKYRI